MSKLFRILCNGELGNSYRCYSIVRVVMEAVMNVDGVEIWVGFQTKNIYGILLRKCLGKYPFVRLKRKLKKIVKIDNRKIGCFNIKYVKK
jgi:hypothetical protein